MPDLVIGARKTNFPRPWRAGFITIAMVGVALVVAWFIYRRSVAYEFPGGSVSGEITQQQAVPGTRPRLEFGTSSLEWAGGLAVLRATGDAHAIGAAHGRLLAPLLPAIVAATKPAIEATITDDGSLGHTTHNMRLAWRWRFVDDGLGESDLRMVAGMTRGAEASGIDVSYDDLLRMQAVLDIGVPAPSSGELVGLAHSLTMIAQQSATPNRVWIGRTFAMPGLSDGGDAATPVIEFAHPDGRVAYASISWPGQIGAITGINAAGIAVIVDPSRTGDIRATRTARPVTMLARAILEQAKTLDEAVKLVETTSTLGSAIFILVDGSTSKWLIVERTPEKAIVERNPKLPAFGDTLTTNTLSSDPENDRAKRMLVPGRVERAARLVRQPLADVAALAKLLSDRHAVDDSPRPLGHRGVIDDGRQIQRVIIDPQSLELWVSDPEGNGKMRAFDLRHELRGEGDRAVPPADLPLDVDPDMPAVNAARGDLRAARIALSHGEREIAMEHAMRALAHAPSLPEALELAGAIAQSRGNLDRAREFFSKWLEGGADDPHGEERAHSLLAR
ncbi:MAG: C45 family autoproteolytic acyltransferase/hydrolase [Kofleriaceae bacterium]